MKNFQRQKRHGIFLRGQKYAPRLIGRLRITWRFATSKKMRTIQNFIVPSGTQTFQEAETCLKVVGKWHFNLWRGKNMPQGVWIDTFKAVSRAKGLKKTHPWAWSKKVWASSQLSTLMNWSPWSPNLTWLHMTKFKRCIAKNFWAKRKKIVNQILTGKFLQKKILKNSCTTQQIE